MLSLHLNQSRLRIEEIILKKVDESHQSGSDDKYVYKIQFENVPKAVNVINEKTLVKTTLNDVKVVFSVDTGSCVNLLDGVRFKEIQSRSKNKVTLKKSKIQLHGYADEISIPVLGQSDALLEVTNNTPCCGQRQNRIRTFVRM